MPDPTNKLTGRCMCGNIHYKIDGAPTYVGICHCDDCRRATGGAYVPWYGVMPEQFSLTSGDITYNESSPGIHRGFCNTCGTALTFGGDGWNDLAITVASLDDPNAVTPESNVFLRDRLHWVRWNEEMRNYDGFPETVKEIR